MPLTRGRPGTRRGPVENLTGTVRPDEITAPAAPSPVEAIRMGDTVWIEPGARHGHGAAPHTFMTLLAVVEDGTTTEWHTHGDDHPA